MGAVFRVDDRIAIRFFSGLDGLGPRIPAFTFIGCITGLSLSVSAFSVLFLFFRRLGDAAAPPEYREAKANGLPATAKVLEIRQTGWHTKRRTNFRLQTTPRRWEYEMRVQVSQPGMPDYEAQLAAYLNGSDVPKKGQVIDIKVHPEQPEVVVIAQP